MLWLSQGPTRPPPPSTLCICGWAIVTHARVAGLRLQLNPDYSTKSATEYARRPNTRRVLRMARAVAQQLQGDFEVTVNHMIQDREGERTAKLLYL